MKLAKAKEYYGLDLITGFSSVAVDGGWLLVVEAKPNAYGSTIETALGEEKIYSSLDSLGRDVERIMGAAVPSWSFKL